MMLKPDVQTYPDRPEAAAFVDGEVRLQEVPPDNISAKVRKSAKQALEDYSKE